jgi:cytochrome c peroxidase
MIFHDASICFEHWHSCASCHPDGRMDGLNWDLLNDGTSNLKNTKSLLLAHKTPPAMSTGTRASAGAAVRAGIKHILFGRQSEQDAAAIDTYLKALKPVPSPFLVNGQLSKSATLGKKLFFSAEIGCSKCHPSPLYTDLRRYDVGTKSPWDARRLFDTPTLVEVWRTAPYLHDGRYTTITELIVKGKHGVGHGNIDGLNEQQIKDLVEFVLSL